VNTPASSIALVLSASFIGSFGAVFLKAGADRLKRSFRDILSNWQLLAGITFYFLSFIVYTLGIRQGELTVLYPMVSLGYLWTLLWSRIFFKEPLTRNKFVGLAMILAGVVMLKMGDH
jgi:multidrug transporter EmrE-like cation transporter